MLECSKIRDILGQRGFKGVEERREPPGKRVDFPQSANKTSLIGGAAMVDDCKQVGRQASAISAFHFNDALCQ